MSDDEGSCCSSSVASTVDSAVQDESGALSRLTEEVQYKLPKGIRRVPWIETLAYTVPRRAGEAEIPEDEDYEREKHFTSLAQEGVVECLRRVISVGLKFTRPDDFYAQMAKSDRHMLRVKKNLTEQLTRQKVVAERRKAKVEKKYNQKVRAVAAAENAAKARKRKSAAKTTTTTVEKTKKKARTTTTART